MKPLSVYVHVPFCTVKCGYCDFNAYAGLSDLKPAYATALVAEVRVAAPLLAGRSIISVAFGGGTPGEMPVSDIAAVLDAIRLQASLATDAEISLEANPGTTDGAQLRELRAVGVTRISFGAQSFHAAELRFLDRIHSPEATAASFHAARAAGFDGIGLDLMYGLPGQEMAAWESSLSRALALKPDHLSLYGLTVEEGTPLGLRVARGRVIPLDSDAAAEMYERATDLVAAVGYVQYELSNWALPGHYSRHNYVYWSDGEYLGIGAGAHGYCEGERYENIAHPRAYIEAVRGQGTESPRPALFRAYRPDPATAMFDWVTLALRRTEGFEISAFERRFGVPVDDLIGRTLRDAEQAGVITRDDRAIRLTRRGRLLHGEVAALILAELTTPALANLGSR